MILEIDAGNTFIKWRMLKGDSLVERGRFLTKSSSWPALKSWEQLDQIRIASVAGADVNERLKELIAEYTSEEPKFATSLQHQSGVINSYDDPSRMGVDRWLVMLAAYNDCKKACCIVDCGSAITVDYISANGQHMGGFIIPGLRLMNSSLKNDTAEIIVDQTIEHFSLSPGTHTSAAVVHGVNYLFNALCKQLCEELRQSKEEMVLYITGGDGELFHKLAGLGKYCPDLVMDGLSWGLE